MQRISDGDWFCANCLQMIDALSRHGRCPFCDSNAVDTAHRTRVAASGRQGEVGLEIVLSINL